MCKLNNELLSLVKGLGIFADLLILLVQVNLLICLFGIFELLDILIEALEFLLNSDLFFLDLLEALLWGVFCSIAFNLAAFCEYAIHVEVRLLFFVVQGLRVYDVKLGGLDARWRVRLVQALFQELVAL